MLTSGLNNSVNNGLNRGLNGYEDHQIVNILESGNQSQQLKVLNCFNCLTEHLNFKIFLMS